MNSLYKFLCAFAAVAGGLAAAEATAQELAYFETTYQTKLEGIAPKAEQTDLDKYYTEIAKQLGIPGLALVAVTEKYGWSKDDAHHFGAIVRRRDDGWCVLFYKIPKIIASESPAAPAAEMRFVIINDQKQVVYCGDPLPEPTAPAADHL